ncbi:MAG: YraN family protein [Nitrospinota bacterium]
MDLGGRDSLGKEGEELACRYLEKQGYKIKERNYRCRSGEIDIIAYHKKTLVFVEVRTKTNMLHGTPAESVNHVKRRKIVKAASYYLLNKGISGVECRFDVVGISFMETECKVELLRNAFV